MIVAFVGNVGGGKTVSAVKRIVESKYMSFVNFDTKAHNVVRLKKEHIVKETVIGHTKVGKEIIKREVNWKFWNDALKKYKEYHLFLDEIHNIAHSRRSMTNWNTLMSIWISQIRKILGNLERTHIYLVSQRIDRIDVAFRDLLNCIIHCEKFQTVDNIRTVVFENGKRIIKSLPVTWILQYYFTGNQCIEDYSYFLYRGLKKYKHATGYIANPYFQYYDSYELFGETAYL